MDRTLSALPRFLSEGVLGPLVGGPPSPTKTPTGVSRGFEIFIQNVNKITSKYEEEQTVRRELQSIQQKMVQPDTQPGPMRDFLCRVVYCGMLGYSVDFAYIHAVKLAQQGTGIEKRMGYLAASLLLHENHQLILLLINTIQKDLKSSNLLENCMALQAASQLVNTELVPMLLPLVQDKLRHPRELVRQKAVMCLHKFMLRAPDLVQQALPGLERCLCDKDPGVMAAAVHIVSYTIKKSPETHTQAGESLINILQQIVTRRMPAMFEYHSIPFPWLQIEILRCLAILGAVDETIRGKLNGVLVEVLQRTSSKETMAFAVLYECIMTIAAINPQPALLEEASKHVGRYLRSNNSNFKYMGVKALTALVGVNPQFAVEYQSVVIEALGDADKAIQRKMFRLLHQMANKVNVKVICNKLTDELSSTTDKYWRSEVIDMVTDLADRLPTSVQWQMETYFAVLQLDNGSATQNIVEKLLALIQKGGTGESQTGQRQFLVKKCLEILQRSDRDAQLVAVAAYVLGENASLLKSLPEDRVISLMGKPLLDQTTQCYTKDCLISGLIKLLQAGVVRATSLTSVLRGIRALNHSTAITQRLNLLYHLAELNTDMTSIGCHGEMDFTLSFLDGFVSQELETGAAPYRPRHVKAHDLGVAVTSLLEATGTAETDKSSVTSPDQSSTSLGARSREEPMETRLNLSGVRRVWGKQGFSDPSSSALSQAITSPDKGDKSVQEAEVSEEERRSRELASALFGGISARDKVDSAGILTRDATGTPDSGISSMQGSNLQLPQDPLSSLDTAGWKQFNKTVSQTGNSNNENQATAGSLYAHTNQTEAADSLGDSKESMSAIPVMVPGQYRDPGPGQCNAIPGVTTVSTGPEASWSPASPRSPSGSSDSSLQRGAGAGCSVEAPTDDLDLDSALSQLLDSAIDTDSRNTIHDSECPTIQSDTNVAVVGDKRSDHMETKSCSPPDNSSRLYTRPDEPVHNYSTPPVCGQSNLYSDMDVTVEEKFVLGQTGSMYDQSEQMPSHFSEQFDPTSLYAEPHEAGNQTVAHSSLYSGSELTAGNQNVSYPACQDVEQGPRDLHNVGKLTEKSDLKQHEAASLYDSEVVSETDNISRVEGTL